MRESTIVNRLVVEIWGVTEDWQSRTIDDPEVPATARDDDIVAPEALLHLPPAPRTELDNTADPMASPIEDDVIISCRFRKRN